MYVMHPLRFFSILLFFWNIIGFIALVIDKNTGVVALMGGFMPLMAFICIITECYRSISEYLKRTNEITPTEEPLIHLT